MISGRTAMSGVGAALLVAYLAAANIPGAPRPALRDREPEPSFAGPEKLAAEVGAQALRLQQRLAQAPTPQSSPRNPFSFGAAPRPQHAAATVRAAVIEEPPAVPPPPALTLMGIAEETIAQGVRRTAVIALRQAQGDPEQGRGVGGDGDTLYLVTEGEQIGARYKVTKIATDAIELEDLVTKAYRRLALR